MRRLRDETLAAVAGRTDAGRRVHVQAHVLTGDQPWLTRVEAYPDTHRDPVRPCMRGKPLLAFDRGLDRIPSAREGEEEAVAFGVDLPAASFLERGPQQPPVHHERVAVLVAETLKQARRALDVAKQQRDDPPRKVVAKRLLYALHEPILIDRSHPSQTI